MAHTPKPWTYGVRRGGSIWISRGDYRKGPHHQGDFIGTEDDARLTTAAPELLEAAKCALGYLTGNMDGDMDLGDPVIMLLEAVAKAEGKP